MNKFEYTLNEFKERLYDFRLPDGTKRKLTIMQARSLGGKEINQRVDEILDDINSEKKKLNRKGDGFTPGWQENIREYVTCPTMYKNKLKQYGLVEIGYDYIPQQAEIDHSHCANAEFVKEALRVGVELSGREIEAIESGEYFKN